MTTNFVAPNPKGLVFTTVCFTGQPETADEYISCPECGTPRNLRWNAWFDRYNHKYGPNGCYVCQGCLSPQRKAELAVWDNPEETTKPSQVNK